MCRLFVSAEKAEMFDAAGFCVGLPLCVSANAPLCVAWAGRTVRILSAFEEVEQAPRLTEGVKLLTGHQKAEVTLVDVSEWDMDKTHKWAQEAQRMLFNISQGQFDVVWITLPHGLRSWVFKKEGQAYRVIASWREGLNKN